MINLECFGRLRLIAMKKTLLNVTLALVSCTAAFAQLRVYRAAGAEIPTESGLTAALEPYLDQLAVEDKFSGTVVITKDGVPVFQKAYGLASRAYNVPNRVDTKFNLGSMNKMFTAVAIAQLVEQGKLSFDDPLIKVLPDYPNKEVAGKITVHQLLTHTSGLGDYFNQQYFDASKARFKEVRDYFSLFVDQALLFPPGQRFSYSNAGFMVLGAVVEKVSGQNYFDYVREHIYKPAGMTNTDAYDLEMDTPNMAIGYTRMNADGSVSDGPRRNNLFLHVVKGGPAGGGFSTAEDLVRFAAALSGHKLLTAHFTDIVYSGKVDQGRGGGKYAYGFEDEMFNGHRRIGHGGGFPGINSDLRIYPDLGYAVAVMSNYDPPAASRVATRIGKLITGAAVPVAVTLAPEILQSCAGRYDADPNQRLNGSIEVAPTAGGLSVKFSGGGSASFATGLPHKFVPMSDIEFFDEEYEDIHVVFKKDMNGHATGLEFKGPGPAGTAHKIG
jgi:CubicO group peptidase (beta-lactamase class C family)